jgi:DNA-binding MarR family transcriptional regulator
VSSAPLPPPSSQLYDAFLELVGRWTTDAVATQLVERSGVDIDEPGLRALSVLDRTAPTTAGALTEPLRTSASNVSKILARLERRGLVERARSSGDGRVIVVRLTPRGRRVTARLRRAGEEMIGELLVGWPAEDAESLAGLLERLVGEVRAQQFGGERLEPRATNDR